MGLTVLGAHRRWLLILGAVAVAGLMAASASAQILYGNVVGVVKDSSGALIPGATVTVVNRDTNLTRETTSNTEGAYSVINLLPGPYDVKVTLTGFRDFARNNVQVTIGEISRVDVTTEVGAVSETVMVTGQAELLQTAPCLDAGIRPPGRQLVCKQQPAWMIHACRISTVRTVT